MVLPVLLIVLALLPGSLALPLSPCVDCGPVAERLTEGLEEGAEIDLMESDDEAVGDRIMEDMNGMKEKFDVVLKRIGDEIDRDQKEQDEKIALK